jgi:hypothetical protein
MDKARVCEKTIAYGKQRYRVDSPGEHWQVLMFGTFGPEDKGIPRHKWMPIPKDKVPDKVREATQ